MNRISGGSCVVALGEHAIDGDGDCIVSTRAIESAVGAVIDACGNEKLAIVHGNGPQYASMDADFEIRWRDEHTPAEVIKATQLLLGVFIHSAIQHQLMNRGLPARSSNWDYTKVVVNPRHSSFKNPVKGIGKWVEGSDRFVERGVPYVENFARLGFFREVVPSPEPLRIVGIEGIRSEVEGGVIKICGGGGGIPVFSNCGCNGDESYSPVPRKVVIDKDATAQLVAQGIGARFLAILTNVDGVYDDFGSDSQEFVGEMTSMEAYQRADANHNGKGSMNPKLRAAADFALSDPSRMAIITTPKEFSRFGRNGCRATVVSNKKLLMV